MPGARSRERRDAAELESGRRIRGNVSGKGLDSLSSLLQENDDSRAPSNLAANDNQGGQAGNSLSPSSTKKKSGKKGSAGKAVEAVDLVDFGKCLICSKDIGLSACGMWVIPGKDEKGGDFMESRYTCSVTCEKKKEAEPRYLGTAIKTRRVTSFAPY